MLATECIRAVEPDFWVRAAEAQLTDPDGRYVFDDVRFLNEAGTVQAHTYAGLWHIMRPGYGPVNGHVSEQSAGSLGEFIVILNTNLDNLHRQLDKAVELVIPSE